MDCVLRMCLKAHIRNGSRWMPAASVPASAASTQHRCFFHNRGTEYVGGARLGISAQLHTHARARARTHTHSYTHTRTCACTSAHTHIHTRTRAHTHTGAAALRSRGAVRPITSGPTGVITAADEAASVALEEGLCLSDVQGLKQPLLK